VVFPSSSSASPAPPFPPRGPSGQFPRFIGTIKALRLPTALPASLRFLRSAVPRSRRLSLSRRSASTTVSLDLCSPVAPPAGVPRTQWDLPGSWMDPCLLATLSDSGETSAPGHRSASVQPWPPFMAPALPMSFRSSITRLACSLSTLRGARLHAPRKTRYRLVASLCRAGLSPAGSATEGFKMATSSLLLPQAYPGARTGRNVTPSGRSPLRDCLR
jgi:hypothetical protein